MYVLSLLTQMLISPRNTLIDTGSKIVVIGAVGWGLEKMGKWSNSTNFQGSNVHHG